MSSVNDLILQLQLLRDAAPSGTVPVQAAIWLAITFGRSQADTFADKELSTCSTYLDHAAFIRTLRRLLPLDEQGTRSAYTGVAPRGDLSDLLKLFGRDPIEVEEYMKQYIQEEFVPLSKFLRIIAKPIAGQRYPIGVYTISRPLAGASAPSKVYATVTKPSNRRDRSKAALGMPASRDAVALALARRLKIQKHRANLVRHRTRRNSDSTETTASTVDLEDRDRDLNVLAFRLCGLNL